jgi:hypothetical protein
MARLLLLAGSTPHLDRDQTETWLGGELTTLVGSPGVQSVSLTRLESASVHSARGWDWLIEVECSGAQDAERATCDGAFRALVGDLRLVGMHPTLALANRPVELTDRPPG